MGNGKIAWKRVFLIWGARLLLLSAVTAGLAVLLTRLLGWEGKRGLSDALFWIGVVEMLIAGVTVWGSSFEDSGPLSMRLWADMRDNMGDLTMHDVIYGYLLNKQAATYTLLVVGALTMIAAALALL